MQDTTIASSQTQETEASDIVWGAGPIGKVINANERQAFHLLERGLLPARKIGGRWAASRRKLLQHVVG
jgi:hypothetical protein